MKIVSVSDIHGFELAHPFLDRICEVLLPDLLVISGDITTFGPASVAERVLRNLNCLCAAIPGNCDPEEVMEIIDEFCISLHGKRENINGIDFVGLGGSPKGTFGTPNELEDEEIDALLSETMVDRCVLVTHAPPRGINDLVPTGIRLGSAIVSEYVKRFKPVLVLSGHVHEARGIVEQDGTVFANPGPLKGGFVVRVDLGDEVDAELLDMSPELKSL